MQPARSSIAAMIPAKLLGYDFGIPQEAEAFTSCIAATIPP